MLCLKFITYLKKEKKASMEREVERGILLDPTSPISPDWPGETYTCCRLMIYLF